MINREVGYFVIFINSLKYFSCYILCHVSIGLLVFFLLVCGGSTYMMNVSTLCLPCRYYHFAFLMVLSCPTEVLNF
jgi:hypothetical protein